MDQHQIHTVSPIEAEQFWADGTDARSAKPGEQPEISTTSNSVGIDLPGVGVTRPDEISSDCTGRENAGGLIGERSPGQVAGVRSLELCTDWLRLFSELLFAARELATAQIDADEPGEPPFCTECVKDAYDANAIVHEDTCRTGRVLRVIGQLVATLHSDCGCSRSDLTPKEAAADGEKPGAGDGVRRPGPPVSHPGWNHVCGQCGKRDGHWIFLMVSDAAPETIPANHVVVKRAGGFLLYAHQCAVAGGAR